MKHTEEGGGIQEAADYGRGQALTTDGDKGERCPFEILSKRGAHHQSQNLPKSKLGARRKSQLTV